MWVKCENHNHLGSAVSTRPHLRKSLLIQVACSLQLLRPINLTFRKHLGVHPPPTQQLEKAFPPAQS